MNAHVFDVDVASEYGVPEAILLHRLMYLIEHNEAHGRYEHEGRTWCYASAAALTTVFPYWTERQIRFRLEKLVKDGVLLSESLSNHFWDSAWDRTNWFALGDPLQNRQIDLQKNVRRSDESVESSIQSNLSNSLKTPRTRAREITLDSVKATAEIVGLVPQDAERCYLHHEARGTLASIVNWKAELQKWKIGGKSMKGGRSPGATPRAKAYRNRDYDK